MGKPKKVPLCKSTKRLHTSDKQEKIKKIKITKDITKQPEYIFKNNLRYVQPYIFKHETYVKDKWLNHSILDVYTHEFPAYSIEYYEYCIHKGLITVNNHIIKPNYILQKNDIISQIIHRHERPIKSNLIQILEETNEFYCVYKPSSIPVHPCGSYNYNTLESIMKNDYNINNFYIINRLDRVTSGLMLLAKSSSIAAKYSKELQSCQAHKVYLCICDGKIDLEHPIDKSHIQYINNIGIQVDIPLSTEPDSHGKYTYQEDGRISCTYFYPLYTYKTTKNIQNNKYETAITNTQLNESTSIDTWHTLLLCIPITGRTHQIRLHTLYMNHPIYNDIQYNPELHTLSVERDEPWTSSLLHSNTIDTLSLEEKLKLTCKYCQTDEEEQYENLYNNDLLYFSSIALHAFIYIMDSHMYACCLPDWNEINNINSEELKQKIHDITQKIFDYNKKHPYLIHDSTI